MGFTYLHDSKNQLLRISGIGAVSMDDRVSLIKQLLSDESLPSELPVIIDVNKVTTTPTPEDVIAIGRLVSQILARFKGRLAIINVTVGHATLSHFVGISADEGGSRVRVCMSEATALAWVEPG